MPVWNSRRCEFSHVNTPSHSKRDWLQTFLVKVSFICMRIKIIFISVALHLPRFEIEFLNILWWKLGIKSHDVSMFRDRNVVTCCRFFFYLKIYIQEISHQDFELFDVIFMVDKRIDHGTLTSVCWISNNPVKQDWDHAHTVPYI